MWTDITPTPQQVKYYLDHKGMRCPNCKGVMVSTCSPPDDSESHEMLQEVECLSCAAKWNDVYALTTIRDFKIYDNMPKAEAK